jgi:hypothetical protein
LVPEDVALLELPNDSNPELEEEELDDELESSLFSAVSIGSGRDLSSSEDVDF